MTKSELIERVSIISGTPEYYAERVLDCTIETIIKAVQSGEAVVLPGFGKFYLAPYEERKCTNPKNGETIVAPARDFLRFKASEKTKGAIKYRNKQETAKS